MKDLRHLEYVADLGRRSGQRFALRATRSLALVGLMMGLVGLAPVVGLPGVAPVVAQTIDPRKTEGDRLSLGSAG